jgi:hypothetical protein
LRSGAGVLAAMAASSLGLWPAGLTDG